MKGKIKKFRKMSDEEEKEVKISLKMRPRYRETVNMNPHMGYCIGLGFSPMSIH